MSIVYIRLWCKFYTRENITGNGKIDRIRISMKNELMIIGGGLAGCEAAWQAAKRGISVRLFEMRPVKQTGAHSSGDLAELVCSNSLGSMLPDRASGLLKAEIKRLGSLLLECAEETAVPAGTALAVDRKAFSAQILRRLSENPNIQLTREEITSIPENPCIIASGPLTSPALSKSLADFTGQDHLFFYDAIAPIIDAGTINTDIAFKASRAGRQQTEITNDYINCPFTQAEYHRFVDELIRAQSIELKDFEIEVRSGVKAGAQKFFEGCLPIEVLARRGENSLAFGPMRPIGLFDPRTGRRPFAVLQLRQDNLSGTLYNMVGFQTNLTFPEQKRVFRMVPGLEHADFVRYGQMHRNTYIASPLLLNPTLESRDHPAIFFAGQITGIEGYLGNIASGLLAGINAALRLKQQPLLEFPTTTMLGGLCYYITNAAMKDYQPMKANMGILPDSGMEFKSKRDKSSFLANRALQDLEEYLLSVNWQ